MKKIIVITFILALFAAPAFAAGEYTGEITAGGETISVLSNKVECNMVSSLTAFAAVTAHTAGSKQYGTSSDSTNLFSSAYEAGTTELVSVTVSDTSSFTSWKAL